MLYFWLLALAVAHTSFSILGGTKSPLAYYLLESLNDTALPIALEQVATAPYSDQEIYNRVVDQLALPANEKSILDWEITHKYHHPRLLAHYNASLGSDKPAYIADGSGKIYDGKLPPRSLNQATLVDTLPFDRVVGDAGPVVAFYGDVTQLKCRKWLSHLLERANAGELRFCWRYMASNTGRELLPGFGVELTIKNPEQRRAAPKSRPDSFFTDPRLYRVFDNELGNKVVSAATDLELLQLILRQLPLEAPFLSRNEPDANVAKHAAANDAVGLGPESFGVYVNGAPINPLELDAYRLYEAVLHEHSIITSLEQLGLDAVQAKLLVTKFALMLAVKQAQFRTGNTVMGHNENRFRLYRHRYNPELGHGVVYFNDIENDETYQMFDSDAEAAYLDLELHEQQIPPLRQNIHDVVVFLNVADKAQLRVFFMLSKLILDRSIPQQVGLVPLPTDDPEEQAIIDRFYQIMSANPTTPQEAMAFLYKYLEAKSEADVRDLMDLVVDPSEATAHKLTAEAFSIDEPLIAINGVIMPLTSKWEVAMGKQIAQDVRLVRQAVQDGHSGLRRALYTGAKNERNTRVVPNDPGSVVYKQVDPELVAVSTLFQEGVNLHLGQLGRADDESSSYGTVWVVGNLSDPRVSGQLSAASQALPEVAIRALDNTNHRIRRLLEEKQLPLHSFLLYNSRYFRIDTTPLSQNDLTQLREYEASQRLLVFDEIVRTFSDKFDNAVVLVDLNPGELDDNDWFDCVTSVITKSFYPDDTLFISDVARYDFGVLDFSNLVAEGDPEWAPVEVLVIADPIDPQTAAFVLILDTIRDLAFVGVRVLLQPRRLETRVVTSAYASGFKRPLVTFENDGSWNAEATVTTKLAQTEYLATIKVPHRWIIQNGPSDFNVDGFEGRDSGTAQYHLNLVLIEGYVRDVTTGKPPHGVIFHAGAKDTTVMAGLGYFQLPLNLGQSVNMTASGAALISASKRVALNTKQTSVEFEGYTLGGYKVYPRVRPLRENDTPIEVTDNHDPETIHIFSIAGGTLYERFLATMTASVRNHTKKPIKFWFVRDFLTYEFQQRLPKLASHFDFDYELILYKWPQFLRTQTEKHRLIWGYKILFLDQLFPSLLERVIFVDADQILRADMSELMELDLEGAPYAFTPMCEDRPEMEGYMFWRLGYWQEVLGEDLRYHISAMFVVDLLRFRELSGGDRLRQHYQKLLSDSSSLANLDQDLPNNMQVLLPIKSLPQEWLWCETWCSEAGKARAKAIDLCNDPVTTEDKLTRAKRVIPEWLKYDDEIQDLFESEPDHDEL